MSESSQSYSLAATQPEHFLSHVITITSETGVGSSSTLKGLQGHCGTMMWRYLSGGSIMRSFARNLGMSIEEFAAFNREHPEENYDLKCDEMLAGYGRQNYTVVEGRLPHVFVPHSFHVRLKCSPEIRAERRQNDEPEKSLAAIIIGIQKRDEDDNCRYEKLYPGCLWPDCDFDCVLSTSDLPLVEVVEAIIAAHADWAKRVRLLHGPFV